MAVATLQVQNQRINALERELEELRSALHAQKGACK
jgi:hypothetical protein